MAEVVDLFPDMKVGEEDTERAKECLLEIVEVLKKHRCAILPEFSMTGPNVSWGVRVVVRKPDVPLTGSN